MPWGFTAMVWVQSLAGELSHAVGMKKKKSIDGASYLAQVLLLTTVDIAKHRGKLKRGEKKLDF